MIGPRLLYLHGFASGPESRKGVALAERLAGRAALERLDLPAGSDRVLHAERETWMLVVGGGGRAGAFEVHPGSAVYASTDRVALQAGADGMVCLVAYAGGGRPAAQLLLNAAPANSADQGQRSTPVSTVSVASTGKPATTMLAEDTR